MLGKYDIDAVDLIHRYPLNPGIVYRFRDSNTGKIEQFFFHSILYSTPTGVYNLDGWSVSQPTSAWIPCSIIGDTLRDPSGAPVFVSRILDSSYLLCPLTPSMLDPNLVYQKTLGPYPQIPSNSFLSAPVQSPIQQNTPNTISTPSTPVQAPAPQNTPSQYLWGHIFTYSTSAASHHMTCSLCGTVVPRSAILGTSPPPLPCRRVMSGYKISLPNPPNVKLQSIASILDELEKSENVVEESKCECGAHKTTGASKGNPGHSSWCPWSKK